jgi:hypothetical protein
MHCIIFDNFLDVLVKLSRYIVISQLLLYVIKIYGRIHTIGHGSSLKESLDVYLTLQILEILELAYLNYAENIRISCGIYVTCHMYHREFNSFTSTPSLLPPRESQFGAPRPTIISWGLRDFL